MKSTLQPPCLTWFNDATFGIFLHWGIYSVGQYEASWSFYNHGNQGQDPADSLSLKDYMAQRHAFLARPAGEVSVKGIRNRIVSATILCGDGAQLPRRVSGGASWAGIPGVLWITLKSPYLQADFDPATGVLAALVST